MVVRVLPGLLLALVLILLPPQVGHAQDGGGDIAGGGGVSEVISGGAEGPDVAGVAGEGGSTLLAREYDLTKRASQTPADPATYQLRRGDTVGVKVLTGEPEDIALDAQVADNGTLTLPWIDPVQVSGLTLAEASEEVRKAYSRIYKRAFAQLLLRRLGSFQIQLAGYYNYPGLYRVYNGTTLYGLLLLLNLDANGERRFMTLHRLKEPAPPHTMPSLSAEAMTPVGDFDPFDFSVKGRFDLDVALEPWDRLVITRPTTVIRLDRGVTRPGAYAVKPGEGLLDILQLAGQVDMTADLQNTTVTRYDETGAPQVSYLDLASAIRDNQMIEVADRDRYYLVSYSRHVFVLGEVAAPGAYPVLPGEGLVELIGRAGGFTENAHTKFISVVRPPRFLKDRPAVENQVEMVDMRAYMKKGSDRERYAIQPGDVIFIPDKGNRLGPGDLFRGALSALGVIVS